MFPLYLGPWAFGLFVGDGLFIPCLVDKWDTVFCSTSVSGCAPRGAGLCMEHCSPLVESKAAS